MNRSSQNTLPRLPRRRDGLIGCVLVLVAAVGGFFVDAPDASRGPWTEDVVSHLTGPDLRLQVGEAPSVEVRAPWAETTDDLFGRVVLFDRPGARPLPPIGARWVPRSTRRDGGWVLETDADPMDEPSASVAPLVDRVRTARVAVVGESGARGCDRWLFDRWVCGPEHWQYVGPTEMTVRGRPWRCIWAHPTVEGPLEITVPGLPAGGVLRGRFAFADSAVERASGVGVSFEVRSGSETLMETEASLVVGHGSWRATLPDDRDEVTIVVRADDVGQRHFCFDATVSAPSSASPSFNRGDARVPRRNTGQGTAPGRSTLRPTEQQSPTLRPLRRPGGT